MIVKGHHFVVSKLACRFLDRLPSCYSSVFPRTDRASWCFPAHRCFEALRTVYSVTGTPLGFKGCRANVSQQIDDFFLLLSNGKPSEEFTQEEFEIEIEHLINTFLIDLPEDQKPNWENEYDWVDENDYYIYDFVTEKLYIIEVEW